MTGTVFNIQRYCTNDGPGVRTTVFLKGCPLDCRWCHNPESKSDQAQILFSAERCLGCGACAAACPKGLHRMDGEGHVFAREGCVACGACARSCAGALELVGEEKSVEDVLAVVLRDKPFYGDEGGMTVSGGEPFAQPDFLLALLAAAKEQGVGTAVETSGFADEKDVRASLPLVDWYLYDCKETDAALHRKWTGVDNEQILTNLAILDEANAQVVLRCPVVPGCNDREDHFRALGEMCRQSPCIRRIEVLPYHPLGVRKSRELGAESPCESIPFPTRLDVEEWKNKIGGKADCPVVSRIGTSLCHTTDIGQPKQKGEHNENTHGMFGGGEHVRGWPCGAYADIVRSGRRKLGLSDGSDAGIPGADRDASLFRKLRF